MLTSLSMSTSTEPLRRRMRFLSWVTGSWILLRCKSRLNTRGSPPSCLLAKEMAPVVEMTEAVMANNSRIDLIMVYGCPSRDDKRNKSASHSKWRVYMRLRNSLTVGMIELCGLLQQDPVSHNTFRLETNALFLLNFPDRGKGPPARPAIEAPRACVTSRRQRSFVRHSKAEWVSEEALVRRRKTAAVARSDSSADLARQGEKRRKKEQRRTKPSAC